MDKRVDAPTAESADDLVVARPLRIETRYIETFGRNVHFRELIASGIDLFLQLKPAADGKTVTVDRAHIISVLQQTVCNANGKLLFDGTEGRGKLEGLPWEGVQELFNTAMECIGITQERVNEKKAA